MSDSVAPPVSQLGAPALGTLDVAAYPTPGQGLALDAKGNVSPKLLAGYPNDATKVLQGDGTWGTKTSTSVVTGSISSAGAIVAGTGFSITKGAAGLYTINFAIAFASVPYVMLTPIAGSDVTAILAAAPTTTSAVVFLEAGSTATDLPFQFVAGRIT